jgi:hypothetical protein
MAIKRLKIIGTREILRFTKLLLLFAASCVMTTFCYNDCQFVSMLYR